MPRGVYKHKGVKGRHWKLSDEIKEKMSISAIKAGTGKWMKGRKISDNLLRSLKNRTKESHQNWKGDMVGYRGIHHWIQRTLGKANKCTICFKTGSGHKIHWANKDHEYKRIEEDFFQACPKCHGEYDKNNNLRKHKKCLL